MALKLKQENEQLSAILNQTEERKTLHMKHDNRFNRERKQRGKAHPDSIWMLLQPDNSIGENSFRAIQHDGTNTNPLFAAFIWQEGSSWNADIHFAWWAPYDAARGFAKLEDAIHWCGSWSWCPEKDQGEAA